MGIISFQGARRSKMNRQEESLIKVSDHMARDLITFSPDQQVMEVIEVMVKNKISGGPVVDSENNLLGIISQGDCIKQLNDSRYYNMPINDVKVKKFMAKNVETIDANSNIFDAADRFLKAKRRQFPIVKEGKLIGQISQKDVMRAALKMKSQHWR